MSQYRLLNIFQIGDVPLHAHLAEFTDYDYTTPGKPVPYVDSYRAAMPESRFNIEPRTISIECALYSDGNRTAEHMAQALENLNGHNTDIILYELTDCCPDLRRCCALCMGGRPAMVWLHGRGRISRLRFRGREFTSFSVQIDVQLTGYLKTVNRMIWQHRARSVIEASTNAESWRTPYLYNMQLFPEPQELDASRCFMWRKVYKADERPFYDPAWFTTLHDRQYLPPEHPATGYASGWSDGSVLHHIYPFKWRWSMPPQSIYLLKNLTAVTSNPTITVCGEAEVWQPGSHTTTVNMDVLDDILTEAGVTLDAEDVLVFGDTAPRLVRFYDPGRPDLCEMNESGVEILAHVAPAIQRTGGQWPGQILPGLNQVRIQPKGALAAQHHYFRRL